MSNREKDPLESQVRILYGQSHGRCAYPQCGKILVMPSRDRRDMPKNVAKVAHITAASPGGPRYDAEMSSDERRSETNLMLMCGDHHDAIDTQLAFHTTKWLRAAKKEHEKTLHRSDEYAMGLVGYKELQMVCDGLVMGVTVFDDEIFPIDLSIDIDTKLDINELGSVARGVIELGMAQSQEVRMYLMTMDRAMLGFSTRLTNRFKGLYYQSLSDGLSGDDIFSNIMGSTYENCGPSLTSDTVAASQAVVAYLFSICEIFEHEPAAAR